MEHCYCYVMACAQCSFRRQPPFHLSLSTFLSFSLFLYLSYLKIYAYMCFFSIFTYFHLRMYSVHYKYTNKAIILYPYVCIYIYYISAVCTYIHVYMHIHIRAYTASFEHYILVSPCVLCVHTCIGYIRVYSYMYYLH